MKDVEYALKVLNSKVYGLRDAMVDNADVYRKFVKETRNSFDILRKRITRVERRESVDRFLIYCVIGRFIYDDYKKDRFKKNFKTRAVARNLDEKIDGYESEV
ncbi:MAG: hypothetical protein J6U54_06250 [Clostridiales bacterium]|nr:hypothetical protein [Clostridiales bacterium]